MTCPTIQIGGNMMHDEVSVEFKKIANGYVLHRSWHEGMGEKEMYHSEDIFLEKLPEGLESLFEKGYMKDMEGDLWKGLKKEKLSKPEEGEEMEEEESEKGMGSKKDGKGMMGM